INGDQRRGALYDTGEHMCLFLLNRLKRYRQFAPVGAENQIRDGKKRMAAHLITIYLRRLLNDAEQVQSF
ncbi:MAG: hypothetical protein E7K92_12730, partial [Serratia marcescens]|nr:hypothetical protein [Serratia marcescens]